LLRREIDVGNKRNKNKVEEEEHIKIHFNKILGQELM